MDHGPCAQLSEADVLPTIGPYFASIVDAGEIWRCEPCQKDRRKSMLIDSELQTGTQISNTLKQIRDESVKQTKHLETEFGKSIDLCHEKIDDLKKIIKCSQEFRVNVHGIRDRKLSPQAKGK